MLARLQRIVAFALLASALGWAACFMALGMPFWAIVGMLLILLGYTFFLGAEFVFLFFIQKPGPASRPGALQLVRAWFGEMVSAPAVFLWRQPFRSNAEPDNLVPHHSGTPGAVFVHGFVCNRGFWNPWMLALRKSGVPFVAVDLEPVFGSIDLYPQAIDAAVIRVEAITGMPVVLVGHSMGGLAIRAWLSQFNADQRVRRVITIGSPHQGTWLARFGHTTNGRQMRLGSPWLAQLASREPADRYTRFTCFFSHCDNIVFPASSGTLPGADNRHVPGTAHVHLAFQKPVFNEVCRWLVPCPEPTAVAAEPASLAR